MKGFAKVEMRSWVGWLDKYNEDVEESPEPTKMG